MPASRNALLAALPLVLGSLAAAQVTPPASVPGKEYSNAQDETALGAADPLQNIQWDNPLAPVDTFDYSGSGPPPEDPDQVDALANHQDLLFQQVVAGSVPFVVSFQGVPPAFTGDDLYYHTPAGGTGVWARGPVDVNVPVPPDDVDAVELWGPPGPGIQNDPWLGLPPPMTDDANNYSYVGDCIIPGPPAPPGTPAVSVFFFVPTNPPPAAPPYGVSTIYITHDELRNAIVAQYAADPNLPDIEPDRPIDVDALMVFDQQGNGIWEDGDTIVFSLWPTALTVQICGGVVPPNPFDGGEIWVWARGTLPRFLVHGGRTWDTANPVGTIFGVPTENIDALEAVTEDWPSFCDVSDGSLASCPCANPGSPDSGCDIAQLTGGVRLDVLAQQTTPANRATVQGTGYPAASAPAAIVIRGTALDPGSPIVFGDGLRCVAAPLVRLAGTFAAGGTSTHAFGHGTAAGPGTFFYQLWFRNQPIMYCDPAAAFNLSNGRSMIW
jgi:hypothetical protein